MIWDSLSISAAMVCDEISLALISVENGLIRLCRVSSHLFLCLPVARFKTKKSLQRPVEGHTILVVKQHQQVNGFSFFH